MRKSFIMLAVASTMALTVGCGAPATPDERAATPAVAAPSEVAVAVGDGNDVSSGAGGHTRVDFSIVVKNETTKPIRMTSFIDPNEGWQNQTTTPADPAPGGFNDLWIQPDEEVRRVYPLIVQLKAIEAAEVMVTAHHGFTLIARNEKGSVMASLPLGMIQPSREKPMYTQWPAGWGLAGTWNESCSGTAPLSFVNGGSSQGEVDVSCRSTQVNDRAKQTTETTILLQPQV